MTDSRRIAWEIAALLVLLMLWAGL